MAGKEMGLFFSVNLTRPKRMSAAIGIKSGVCLGGKGANLADMISIGVPVPPGFHRDHRSLQCLSGGWRASSRRVCGTR